VFGHNCTDDQFWQLNVDSGCNGIKIRAASTQGKSTVFEVKFPLTAPEDKLIAYISFSQPVDASIIVSETDV